MVDDGMQIGDLSARTGATVRMLRYYEEHGLLQPRRTPSGYRVFAESDVLRVRYIRCMLGSGLPARVVGHVLSFLLDGRPPVPAEAAERTRLAEVLEGELATLTERIAILERSRQQLEGFISDVRQDVVGPGHPEPDPAAGRVPAKDQGASGVKVTARTAAEAAGSPGAGRITTKSMPPCAPSSAARSSGVVVPVRS